MTQVREEPTDPEGRSDHLDGGSGGELKGPREAGLLQSLGEEVPRGGWKPKHRRWDRGGRSLVESSPPGSPRNCGDGGGGVEPETRDF